eukprot:2271942-Heterocapsa_arctica.AAC.1
MVAQDEEEQVQEEGWRVAIGGADGLLRQLSWQLALGAIRICDEWSWQCWGSFSWPARPSRSACPVL